MAVRYIKIYIGPLSFSAISVFFFGKSHNLCYPIAEASSYAGLLHNIYQKSEVAKNLVRHLSATLGGGLLSFLASWVYWEKRGLCQYTLCAKLLVASCSKITLSEQKQTAESEADWCVAPLASFLCCIYFFFFVLDGAWPLFFKGNLGPLEDWKKKYIYIYNIWGGLMLEPPIRSYRNSHECCGAGFQYGARAIKIKKKLSRQRDTYKNKNRGFPLFFCFWSPFLWVFFFFCCKLAANRSQGIFQSNMCDRNTARWSYFVPSSVF
jgi:hypothetical protein